MHKNKSKHIFLGVAAVLLSVGFIFVVTKKIEHDTKHRPRTDFEKAETAVQSLFADVSRQAGVPDASIDANHCSRPSVKFQDAPLSCRVSKQFSYIVEDISEAQGMVARIDSVIIAVINEIDPGATPDIIEAGNKIVAGKPLEPHASREFVDAYSLMDCSVYYAFIPFGDEQYYLQAEKTKNSLFIDLSCRDFARDEYYPVE